MAMDRDYHKQFRQGEGYSGTARVIDLAPQYIGGSTLGQCIDKVHDSLVRLGIRGEARSQDK